MGLRLDGTLHLYEGLVLVHHRLDVRILFGHINGVGRHCLECGLRCYLWLRLALSSDHIWIQNHWRGCGLDGCWLRDRCLCLRDALRLRLRDHGKLCRDLLGSEQLLQHREPLLFLVVFETLSNI